MPPPKPPDSSRLILYADREVRLPPARWCGVGSADASAVDPGVTAADQALLHDDPKLVVVFSSGSLDLARAL
jgi:hypothetical protein